jgi:hypothetical protein
MKFKLTTIIVVALTLLVGARAQQPQRLDRATTSSIKSEQDKDGNIVITTINRDFKLLDEPCPLDAPKSYINSLLLLQEFTTKQASNREDEQGTIKVEAWLGLDVGALSKKWEFQQEGHTGKPVDCFYKVTKYGCCMARATDVYYSLITGQKVFTSNSPLFGVVVPNTTITLDRYFAYLSADNSLEDRQGANAADFVAVVQYGSETSVLNRIAVYSERAEYLPPPKISLRYEGKSFNESGLMLWKVDGKKTRSSLSDFALVLSYEKAGDVVIPVHEDSPDIAKATVPKQFRLESLSSTTKGPQTARAN